MAINPDGKLLAAAYELGEIRLWDLASGSVIKRIPFELVPNYEVKSLAFSPDGRFLAYGATDGAIRLWDVAETRPAGPPLRGHKGAVIGVAFGLDGTLLLLASASSASSDEPVLLWDVATRKQLGPLLVGHRDRVSGLAFRSDSRVLLSASAAGAVLRWNVSLKSWLARARRLANRSFTWDEWRDSMHEQPYHKTCSSAPVPVPELEPFLDELKRQAASAPDKASAAYARAVQFAVQTEDPLFNNNLCWEGSLDGFAGEVLAAGERAVSLEPNRPEFHDTTGFARALIGDRAGAIADFTFYVENYKGDAELRELRKKWIQDLQDGRNPFTKETLAVLRKESVAP
jgi:hypothetical protein